MSRFSLRRASSVAAGCLLILCAVTARLAQAAESERPNAYRRAKQYDDSQREFARLVKSARYHPYLDGAIYSLMDVRRQQTLEVSGEPDIELVPEAVTLVRAIRSIHGQCDRRELEAAWLPSLHVLASWTLPFLDAEQMAVIWRDIESADCFDELSADARMQLEVLKATSEADHERVASLADRILASGRGAGRRTPMVLLAAMASHLALEDPQSALALWRGQPDSSRDDIRLRWMAAHAAAQQAEQRIAVH